MVGQVEAAAAAGERSDAAAVVVAVERSAAAEQSVLCADEDWHLQLARLSLEN